MFFVAPPLAASGPSFGVALTWSPATALSVQPLRLVKRLPLSDIALPRQSGAVAAVLSAMTFPNNRLLVPVSKYIPPPPENGEPPVLVVALRATVVNIM